MRNRITGAVLALAALACAVSVNAADNYQVKDGSGATITMKAKEAAGVKAVTHTVANSDGTTLINPATSDKQPSLGTAGSPSSNVITVQGVTSMTALKVDGSAVTQPVSGTFWQATQPVSGTFWQTTQPVSAAALPLPTGAATAAKQDSIISALGSPMQTSGGSVTANLGTLNGAATAANQTTLIGHVDGVEGLIGTTNSSLSTIATNTTNAGAPSVAQDSTGNVKIIQASASAAVTISTATTTQMIALTSSKKIFVTSFNLLASGTTTATWVTGTGTNCGTGQTSLTGAYDLAAQAGLAVGGGLGPVLVVPAGQALCLTNSAAIKVTGSVAYTVQP